MIAGEGRLLAHPTLHFTPPRTCTTQHSCGTVITQSGKTCCVQNYCKKRMFRPGRSQRRWRNQGVYIMIYPPISQLKSFIKFLEPLKIKLLGPFFPGNTQDLDRLWVMRLHQPFLAGGESGKMETMKAGTLGFGLRSSLPCSKHILADESMLPSCKHDLEHPRPIQKLLDDSNGPQQFLWILAGSSRCLKNIKDTDPKHPILREVLSRQVTRVELLKIGTE